MNYMATDIEKLSLKKELINGYNKRQVEIILARINEDYHELEEKIGKLQNEATIMKETVQHYKTIEESLQHTLILAHSTSESIKLNATEKAANIIHEAEIKAKNVIDDADKQVIKIKNEYEELKRNLSCYKIKTMSLLSSLQDLLKEPLEENVK